MQARQGKAIDPVSGARRSAATDFQSPYLLKLLSSAPLSKDITYYFYAIMAEKGGNGEIVVEDAWFRHADIFGSGIGMMLGQFSLSDAMFPREIRLPFQDYMVYRMAGITYEESVRIMGEWTREPAPLLAYRRGGAIAVLAPDRLAALAEGLEELPAAAL